MLAMSSRSRELRKALERLTSSGFSQRVFEERGGPRFTVVALLHPDSFCAQFRTVSAQVEHTPSAGFESGLNREAVQIFFSILTVVVLAGTIACLACRALGSRYDAAGAATAALSRFALPLAAAIALTSMLGSLYFSEVANYLPCTLCWYQRIAMYPLGVILVIASVRRDRAIRWYVVPLAGIGALISLYHWILERFPDLDAGVCSVQVPCEFVWFERFGFITLPFMALTAFVAVITLVALPDKE